MNTPNLPRFHMKSLPPLLLLLSLVASPARADEQTFYYWANTNGGN